METREYEESCRCEPPLLPPNDLRLTRAPPLLPPWQAVRGIHELKIVHSDLKPANFLLVQVWGVGMSV